MERIEFATGLDSFIMPDEITGVGGNAIEIIKNVRQAEPREFVWIETLAQAGALHVRYLTHFAKHAFLLKINHYAAEDVRCPPGAYVIKAALVSSSKTAYSYQVRAEKEGIAVCCGSFLFATVEYGDSFRKEELEQHYRKVFSCLTENLNGN